MLFQFVVSLIFAIGVVVATLQIVPALIYLERKIAAYIQGRLGPNRVNFEVGHLRYILPASWGEAIPENIARLRLVPGSLQPLADGIKLAFKEEIVPKNADKLLWNLGPALAFIPVAVSLAFLPFAAPFQIGPGTFLGLEIGAHTIDPRVASANIGVLGLVAISSLGVYGIACGGWGSGSKFPLMGAVRATAQMISYEVALGLALVAAIVTTGTVDAQEMVRDQATRWQLTEGAGIGWGIFRQPLAAFIFVIAMFAENNRLPFDLPEAEPELIGGYHTEYTGLKFGVFFLGEYTAMIVMCGLFVTAFLGGWSFPWLVDPTSTSVLNTILSHFVFMAKLLSCLFFMLWIRWTLPRFRYDQLMHLGWKVLVPLALVNLVVTAFAHTFWNKPIFF